MQTQMSDKDDDGTMIIAGRLFESGDALKARLHFKEMALNRAMKQGLDAIYIAGRRWFDRERVDEWLLRQTSRRGHGMK